ncbi:plasminogen-like [Dendronephthya gigantea]|uniref:plasminogen-like n=1 Tax=Dendronephthya gigantea TaxID=151771 RepID=UPI001069CCC6|nr:plasminogen-like [Dendronephthya gigantea]XP_028392264.1 plasminogen-like [Dendronephthya gigantea]
MKIRTMGGYFVTWLVIMTCCAVEVFPQKVIPCGIRPQSSAHTTATRKKRVIGGHVAPNNSWPWLVNFIDKDDTLQYCSGVIIAKRWILTVAHCFIFYGPDGSVVTFPVTKYKYIIADHRYNVTDHHEFTVQPSMLFIHPKYKIGDDFQPGDYDIALIKLKRPLRFFPQVNRACLPVKNTIFNTTSSCFLAGWGNTVNTTDYYRSPVLKQVQLKLVPLKNCNSKTVYNGIIPSRYRCAGYPQGGKDGCYGDSGAPLQCNIHGSWTVAGIMSWGSECAAPNRYGVYVDVLQFMTRFIQPVMQGRLDRLTTYHKRPLSRFKKKWKIKKMSFYLLFTKKDVFTDIDLVRNLQLTPLQIALLKNITLRDYVFVICTHHSVSSLIQSNCALNRIVAGFKRNSRKFENYDKIRSYGKLNNITVENVIKMAGVPKNILLNSKNLLSIVKKRSPSRNVALKSLSG